MKLDKSFKNKDSKERAEIKAQKISKVSFRGKFKKESLTVEIIDIKKIDGGVSVYARAWKGKSQIGFGKDGSVDIERFNIYNPPILVPDKKGDIEKKHYNYDEEEHVIERYREDPEEAIKMVVADNINNIGKEGKNIKKGKVGRTTSTFYPDASPESTTHDGRHYISNATYSTAHDASSSSSVSDNDATWYPVANNDRGSIYEIRRGQFLFDATALGTDTVDSAVLSIYGNQTTYDDGTDNDKVNLYSVATASNTSISTSDFGNFGTTPFSTQIDIGSWNSSGYNAFTLNASGLANITAGICKFGFRSVNDVNNTTPTGRSEVGCYFADESGTTKDPKLVVEHSAGAINNNLFLAGGL